MSPAPSQISRFRAKVKTHFESNPSHLVENRNAIVKKHQHFSYATVNLRRTKNILLSSAPSSFLPSFPPSLMGPPSGRPMRWHQFKAVWTPIVRMREGREGCTTRRPSKQDAGGRDRDEEEEDEDEDEDEEGIVRNSSFGRRRRRRRSRRYTTRRRERGKEKRGKRKAPSDKDTEKKEGGDTEKGRAKKKKKTDGGGNAPKRGRREGDDEGSIAFAVPRPFPPSRRRATIYSPGRKH